MAVVVVTKESVTYENRIFTAPSISVETRREAAFRGDIN